MAGCLGLGAASAKALAAGWGKPVIGIHHMVSWRTGTYFVSTRVLY
jgi:tRNA A37 threonylcarbamoyltransferase TsaD